MASINRYQSINDIPASKGRDVLFKILNSSKADSQKLQSIASDYEKTALEMMAREERKTDFDFIASRKAHRKDYLARHPQKEETK